MPSNPMPAFHRKAPKSGQKADPAGSSAHATWIYLALPLILLNPFVVYLRFHDYDLFQPESLLCMAMIAGLGMALAATAQLSRQVLQFPFIVLALAVFADIAWTEPQRAALFQWLALGPELAGSLQTMIFPLMLAAIALITGLVKPKLSFIATVVFGVMLLSSLVLPQSSGIQEAGAAVPAPAGELQRELPTVVHIVLDEQIGVEGLPPELPSSRALQAELTAFYLDRGFTLFGRAFSHYYMTADSLPNMFNGTAHKRRNAHIRTNGDSNKFRLLKNAWFDRLSEQGYRIKVFQTDYLDFCAGGQVRSEDCVTLPTIALRGLMTVDLSIGDKSTLLFENFLQNAFLLRVAARVADRYAPGDAGESGQNLWHWRPRPLTSLSAMSLIEQFQAALGAAQPGTAYFAHLLLPHHALIYDRDCQTAAKLEDWMNSTDALLERSSIRNTAAMRAARYERYVEQVRCTHVKLAEMLSALRAAGRFDDAIIIVHGDHGSRISQREALSSFAEALSDDDIRDSYSTLFALRTPDQAPGYRQDSRSIQALFADYLIESPLAEETQDVYLNQPPGGAGAALDSRPMVDFPAPIR